MHMNAILVHMLCMQKNSIRMQVIHGYGVHMQTFTYKILVHGTIWVLIICKNKKLCNAKITE